MKFSDLLKHIPPEDIVLVDNPSNDEGYAFRFVGGHTPQSYSYEEMKAIHCIEIDANSPISRDDGYIIHTSDKHYPILKLFFNLRNLDFERGIK